MSMREQSWEDIDDWCNPIEPDMWEALVGPTRRLALIILVGSAAQSVAVLALAWKLIS